MDESQHPKGALLFMLREEANDEVGVWQRRDGRGGWWLAASPTVDDSIEEARGSPQGIASLFRNTDKEEVDPFTPLSDLTDSEHEPVVPLPMSLEIGAQVQQRLRQQAVVTKQYGDQQPANAAVAIEERMDGLELGMS